MEAATKKDVTELQTKKTPAPTALKVELAQLHQPVTASAVIPSDKTLSKQKMPNGTMLWTPAGLLIKNKGKTVLVPQANVAFALLED